MVRLGPFVPVIALALSGAPAWAQQPRSQAPTIDTIIVITHDVFDSSEARRSVAFQLANAIRFRTRPEIVRRELLFHQGEPYDEARVAETRRNLRRLGLFRAIAIDTLRLGARLAVRVETHDGWTTQLELNARSTGGEFTWSAGLQEVDFLGLALAVGARYRKDTDRTAMTFLTSWSRVPGTRAQVAASYDDRSDGRLAEWALGVPFRAFADPNAWEWFGAAGRHRVLRFRDGDSLDSWQRRILGVRVSAALAPYTAEDGYLRLGLLGQIKREAYVVPADTLSPVPDSVTAAVGLQADWRRARFKLVTHYNGFAREEDIDLSSRVRLAAWVAPTVFGYANAGVGPELEVQTGIDLGKGFVQLEARGNGLFGAGGLDSARVFGGFTVASRVLSRQATVLHVEGGVRRRLPPGAEFDLGHALGPRAFHSHAFTGTRSVWGTLEHRWFAVDEVLHLLGIGFATFLDYGGAWYADEPARAGGDLGLGLRLGATRATGANVGRFDLAYRFGEGWTRSRWQLSLGRSFAFSLTRPPAPPFRSP